MLSADLARISARVRRSSFMIAVILICSIVLMLLAVIDFIKTTDLAAKGNLSPQSITCRDLITNGAGGKPFVTVSGYRIRAEYLHKDLNTAQKFYIPIFPADLAADEDVNEFTMVIRTIEPGSSIEIPTKFLQGAPVTGFVSKGLHENVIYSMELKLDWNNCLNLDADYSPTAKGRSVAFFVAGAVMLSCCIGYIRWYIKQQDPNEIGSIPE